MESNTVTIARGAKTILVGAGGSGKDFVKTKCRGAIKCDVSYTSRPKRQNEVDGVDYIFVTKEKFEEMIKDNMFLQFNLFGNGHYYGTSLESWETNELFIFSPNVLNVVKLHIGDFVFQDCNIIYLCIDEKIRRQRLIERNDADSVERRLGTDREDFASFISFTSIVTDPNFTVEITD